MAARDPPTELLESLSHRPAVIVCGAGVTAATLPNSPIASWDGLLRAFLDKYEPDDDDRESARNLAVSNLEDPTAANLIEAATKLRAAWGARTFYAAISDECEVPLEGRETGLIKAIGALGRPILTTNFDTLIDTTLQLGTEILAQTERGLGIIEGRHKDVLHIHGHHKTPSSLVIDAPGYEQVLGNEMAQAILTNLASKTLVFVGCGSTIDDPNLGSLHRLLGRLREYDPSASYFRLLREEDATRQSDGVVKEVVYGPNFPDLVPFLFQLTDATVTSPPRSPIAAARAWPVAPVENEPIDIVFRIEGPRVRIKCAMIGLNEAFTWNADWARRTSVEQLEAELYADPDITEDRQRTSAAQLLGNHLLMMYDTILAKTLRMLPQVAGQRYRLVLDLAQSDDRLRPWESLYSRNSVPDVEPSRGFIADSLELSIVRRGLAHTGATRMAERTSPTLKVVLAVSDPEDRLKAGDLGDGLREGSELIRLQPPSEEGIVTKTTIRDALKRWQDQERLPVDVLHIVACLGPSARNQPPTIELDDGLLDSEDLARWVCGEYPPRLTILQLEPVRGAGSGAVLEVAYTASRGGVSNLLAVHHNSGHRSTTAHLRELYRALSKGTRLDQSLQVARAEYSREEVAESVAFPALFVEPGAEDIFCLGGDGGRDPGRTRDPGRPGR